MSSIKNLIALNNVSVRGGESHTIYCEYVAGPGRKSVVRSVLMSIGE
jgi:hypothetical protein